MISSQDVNIAVVTDFAHYRCSIDLADEDLQKFGLRSRMKLERHKQSKVAEIKHINIGNIGIWREFKSIEEDILEDLNRGKITEEEYKLKKNAINEKKM
jgi:hypothetical protein